MVGWSVGQFVACLVACLIIWRVRQFAGRAGVGVGCMPGEDSAGGLLGARDTSAPLRYGHTQDFPSPKRSHPGTELVADEPFSRDPYNHCTGSHEGVYDHDPQSPVDGPSNNFHGVCQGHHRDVLA